MSLVIAVPTGALLKGSLDLLRLARVADLEPAAVGRRLLVDAGDFRLILVRPTDVPAYVHNGAADVGIVGKDTLWEAEPGHYELVDLRFAAVKLVVAVPDGSGLNGPESWPPVLRVATKYPRATRAYMDGLGHAVEVVRLHGSVELAPLVGLTDAIVDLTETGTTLRENHLRVVAEIGASTARLIANRASLKTRSSEIQAMATSLRQAVGS